MSVAALIFLDATEHGEFDLVITTLLVNTDIFTVETVLVEENVVETRDELRADLGDRFPIIQASTFNNTPFAMLNEDLLMQRELNDLIHVHNLQLKKEVECTSLEALVEMVKIRDRSSIHASLPCKRVFSSLLLHKRNRVQESNSAYAPEGTVALESRD